MQWKKYLYPIWLVVIIAKGASVKVRKRFNFCLKIYHLLLESMCTSFEKVKLILITFVIYFVKWEIVSKYFIKNWYTWFIYWKFILVEALVFFQNYWSYSFRNHLCMVSFCVKTVYLFLIYFWRPFKGVVPD